MTSEVILHFMINLHLHNVSIYIYFFQNLFINEYTSKYYAKRRKSLYYSFYLDVEELMLLINNGS